MRVGVFPLFEEPGLIVVSPSDGFPLINKIIRASRSRNLCIQGVDRLLVLFGQGMPENGACVARTMKLIPTRLGQWSTATACYMQWGDLKREGSFVF